MDRVFPDSIRWPIQSPSDTIRVAGNVPPPRVLCLSPPPPKKKAISLYANAAKGDAIRCDTGSLEECRCSDTCLEKLAN